MNIPQFPRLSSLMPRFTVQNLGLLFILPKSSILQSPQILNRNPGRREAQHIFKMIHMNPVKFSIGITWFSEFIDNSVVRVEHIMWIKRTHHSFHPRV